VYTTSAVDEPVKINKNDLPIFFLINTYMFYELGEG